jgi:phage-related protein/DNA-binding XRE family transcriptional regulator
MKKVWEVVLYSSKDGRDSVINEIDSFEENEAIKIYKMVEILKTYGHAVLENRIKYIDGKIWEIKIDRYQVLYFLYENQHYILVRAFMKKTNKAPKNEIEIAEKGIPIIFPERKETNMKVYKIPEGCRAFNDVIKEKLKDTEFKKAWNELDAEFAAERALIELRMRSNETQKKLADKLNTKQAYISKVESGRVSPTISYIAKMADALNADAEIVFRPRGSKDVIKAVLVKEKKRKYARKANPKS